MAYNNITTRAGAQALVPEEVSNDLLNVYAPKQSAALTMFRSIPVARNVTRMPILAALPLAYWVTGGDTGLKQTTQMGWANKFLNIEEMATIMPVPDNVLDDVDQDIWDSAMPLLVEAFGRTLDTAIFFGASAPASFPTNIMTAATNAGNAITEGSANTAGGFFGDLDKTYGAIEGDGYESTGFVASTAAKSKFRAARDSLGQKLDTGRISGNLGELDGLPVAYPMRGLFPGYQAANTTSTPNTPAVPGVRLFNGDWSQFIIGLRSDITMKVLTEAVIQDNTGSIIFNLAQQDMTAVRLTFRLGWQVANTINADQPTEANRYPASVLLTAS